MSLVDLRYSDQGVLIGFSSREGSILTRSDLNDVTARREGIKAIGFWILLVRPLAIWGPIDIENLSLVAQVGNIVISSR
jgi:hypothetical protein